jgi:hypothetical protein
LETDREAFARDSIDRGHDIARIDMVCHVIDARSDIDQRLEHRVGRHVRDALPIHPDFATVADRLPIFVTGSNHAHSS